ncbi:cysteine hydrolase family protein [Phyllobacterium sp. K27]
MHSIDLEPGMLETWRGPLAEGIDPNRTALMVIDLQLGFMDESHPGYVPGILDIVRNVNLLTQAFRTAGARVVFTRHTIVDDPPRAPPAWQLRSEEFRPIWDTLRPGLPTHDLFPGIDVGPDDWVVDKYRFCAILPNSSSLDRDFRAAGIDTVVIAGAISNVCCESTSRNASMLDYEVAFVADATAAADDAAQNAALSGMAVSFANVKTTEQVIGQLR